MNVTIFDFSFFFEETDSSLGYAQTDSMED